MKIGNLIREGIKKVDFFKTSELLRYKAESDYKTVFGGLVSLLLILLLFAMFYYKLLSCIRKDEVNATQEKIINEIPTSYTIATYPRGNFMLAVSIGVQKQRFFNVQMDSIKSLWDYQKNEWNQTVNTISLQKCTREHWRSLPRMEKQYDSWGLDDMLCLPMNSAFEIQGDELSDISKKLSIKIRPCENDSNSQIKCAQQSQIDQLFSQKQSIRTRIYMINPNVNPSTKNYIQYTFNYNNLLTFTRETGSSGTIYVEEYEIQTDDSILPLPLKKTDTGATLSTTIIPKAHRRVDENSPYCEFTIYKSDVAKKYTRNFVKFDQLLAFIGGLFGTLSIFLSIVNSYNNFAYQISIGSSLFKPQNQNQMTTFKKYNFFSYLLQIIYTLFNYFGFYPNWKSTIEYNKCQQEMEKQLDIQYILDRLTYLQTATSTLLEDYQIKGLHLKGKLTLKEAKNRRRAFKLKKGIRQIRRNVQKQHIFQENSSNFKLAKKFSQQNEMIRTNGPKCFGFFPNNKINEQFQMQKSEIVSFEQNFGEQSDSSTDEQQFSKRSDQDSQVLGVLNRLREESKSGDKLSKKIWDITNDAIVKIIPDLLTRGNDIFFNLSLESLNKNSFQSQILNSDGFQSPNLNSNSLQSPKFSQIMSIEQEQSDSAVNESVVNNGLQPKKARIRVARYVKKK